MLSYSAALEVKTTPTSSSSLDVYLSYLSQAPPPAEWKKKQKKQQPQTS